MSVVGIDMGGTKIAAALVGEDLTILSSRQAPTPAGARSILAVMAAHVTALARAAGGRDPVRAVGVGVPSLIHRRTGRVAFTTHADLKDLPIAAEIEARVGLPACVDNDANVAALAEQRAGAARGARDVVMLTLGTGVGGGVIRDGRILHSGRNGGMELGHIVVDADGPECPGACPGRGCVEAFASGTAIARAAAEEAGRDPSGPLAALAQAEELNAGHVAELAAAGDPASSAILDLAGRRLGVALASLANVFDPDVLVVGGGVARIGERILAPAREEYRARVLPPMRRAEVVPAAFGNAAGALGAAALALDLLADPA